MTRRPRAHARGLALRASAGLLGLALLLLGPLAATVGGAEVESPSLNAVEFGEPRASGDFGDAVTFETTFESTERPRRVELLTSLPHDPSVHVSVAGLEPIGPGRWRAAASQGGHLSPNTVFDYRFRVVLDDETVTGPEGQHRLVDTRFTWQHLAGDHVTVWWHQGDRAFAERALAIAEAAVASTAELLGVTDVEPLDFFIYSDNQAFREALGPGARENVGGEAHPDIRTLFGLIEPRQVGSDWVEELVVHELAHLIFDEAVRNPYGYPPRWLNEGLAVWVSTGRDADAQPQVAAAAGAGSIIPLDGLAGQFPTRPTRFGLAYAESVSAVDHFIERFGEAGLLKLVAAFAEGASTEEAFQSATGASFTDFEDTWLDAIGAERPQPYGPPLATDDSLPDAPALPGDALLR